MSEESAQSSVRTAVWTNEAVAAFWDYRSRSDPPGGYFAEVHAPGLLRLARWLGVLSPGNSIVDYGCGRGPLIGAALDAGYEAGGVEFSSESAALVDARYGDRRGYRGTRVVGSGSVAAAEPADAAFCLEVVEHLTDEYLEPTFAALAASVRPGGAVIVTTPFDEDLAAHMTFCPFCRTEFHHMQHVRAWTVESLSRALEAAGLQVRECRAVDLKRFAYGRPAGRREKIEAAGREAVIRVLETCSSRSVYRFATVRPGENLLAVATKPVD